MQTRAFWIAALERALKTAAQAALLVFGADTLDAMNASWGDAFGFALVGFVLSLLTSVVSSPAGSSPGPSLTYAETLARNPLDRP